MDITSSILFFQRQFLRATETARLHNCPFTVVLAVRGQAREAAVCLKQLRGVYADVTIICIGDGDNGPEYSDVKQLVDAFVPGERLKKPGSGHLYLRRFFELEVPKDHYLIKIDADTRINRPFAFLPDADLFGTLLAPVPALFHIQGGCQGFSPRARELLLDELADERYALLERWCQSALVRLVVTQHECRTETANCDFLLTAAARRAKLQLADWTESLCLWRKAPADRFIPRYAVTHPHKSFV